MSKSYFIEWLALVTALVITAMAFDAAHADTYQVEGKTFKEKGEVIAYVLQHNKNAVIKQTRDVILTPKLTFKVIQDWSQSWGARD